MACNISLSTETPVMFFLLRFQESCGDSSRNEDARETLGAMQKHQVDFLPKSRSITDAADQGFILLLDLLVFSMRHAALVAIKVLGVT